MQKLDSSVTTKWLKYAIINIIILTVIYGSMIACYTYFAVNSRYSVSEKQVQKYADTLASQSVNDIKSIISGESDKKWLINSSCSFALYEKRLDGTLSFSTNSVYLLNLATPPGLSIKLNEPKKEKIGEVEFLTYTTTVTGYDGEYVKVFLSLENYNMAMGSFAGGTIFFVFLFFVVSFITSICIGYLQIKPILTTYEKQKSFINDMSHEIRTPLSIIKGHIENIKSSPNVEVKTVLDLLDEMQNEVEYMADMSSGLLNIVKNGNKTAHAKNGDLTEIISNVLDIYSEMISVSNKSLLASYEQVDMQFNKEKIKQLLVILLDNAIKYTSDGDKIKVKLKKTKTGCLLSVSDTGIGVAESELALIFERFYRADNAKHKDGTGLGLAIAKSIVDGEGGTILAKNNFPKGLSVIVEFKNKK